MSPHRAHPIKALLSRPYLQVLGINSGTSLNGLDLALIRVRPGRPVRLLHTQSLRFPARLRGSLLDLATSTQVKKSEVAGLNLAFSRWMASCVLRFRQKVAKSDRVDLIGVHGQTIGHFPGQRGHHATWQLVAPSVLAIETGIVTAGDFRTSDVAAGGMGAPLSGYYHHLLFGPEQVVLNLGGIANISASRRRRGRLEILAFDIGPANMILDGLARLLLGVSHDKDGRHAARGEALEDILTRALRHPYFRRRPPKTCGREEFGMEAIKDWFGRSMLQRRQADHCLATALTLTVRAIAHAVQTWVEPFTQSRTLILTGGGAS
ncbi:MAG: anhydro-N-acetylmuramic acid kinase, partial [Candidatus Zixiibacteriota bacterium]